MLRTLIVGYGHAGGDLHLPSVRKAREFDNAGIFASQRPCAIDPQTTPLGNGPEDVHLRQALEETGDLDPAGTVAHICTPPASRAMVIETLVGYGFRRFIIEKPLATSLSELCWLEQLSKAAALDIGVSIPWLSSALTCRLEDALLDTSHGPLKRIESVQDKPRFSRSLRNMDHASAFDVELPHAVAVVSHLAGGPVEVTGAGRTNLLVQDASVPNMGGAWIETRHRAGVTSRMHSDLQAPRRERLLRLIFASGVVTGYYAVSGEDPYAQIVFDQLDGHRGRREVIFDDPFPRMMLEWYRYFAGLTPRPISDFHLNASVVRTIALARARCELESPHMEVTPAR